MNTNRFQTEARIYLNVLMWMIVAIICILPVLWLIIASDYQAFIMIKDFIVACINIDDVKILTYMIGGACLGMLFVKFIMPANIIILRQLIPFIVQRPKFEGTKITEKENPKLINFINELADSVNIKRPKDGVYITEDSINKIVSYPRIFGSFEAIILGLTYPKYMNRAEYSTLLIQSMHSLKARTSFSYMIIFHLHQFISNIYEINKKWINTMDKLKHYQGGFYWKINLAVRMNGYFLYYLTYIFITILDYLENKCDIAIDEYEKLLTLKDYDFATEQVGSNIAISATSKMEEIDRRYNEFHDFCYNLAKDGFIIDNYWETYTKIEEYIAKATGKRIVSSISLTKPIYPITYALTPDIDDHSVFDYNASIQRMREEKYPAKIIRKGSAADLMPKDLYDKMGREALYKLKKQHKEDYLFLTKEEIDEAIEEKFCNYPYMRYFERGIIPFDFEHYAKQEEDFDPLSEENIELNCRYIAAKSDFDRAFDANTFKGNRNVEYKGELYKAEDLPLDEIRENYEMLKNKVRSIDENIYATALRYADNPDEIKEAYRRILIAQDINSAIDITLKEKCSELIDTMDRVASANMKYRATITFPVYFDFQQKLSRYVLDKIEYKYIKKYISDEEMRTLKCYQKEITEGEFDINPEDKINTIVDVYKIMTEANRKMLKEDEDLVIRYAKGADEKCYKKYKTRELPIVQQEEISHSIESIKDTNARTISNEKAKGLDSFLEDRTKQKSNKPVYNESEDETLFKHNKFLILFIGSLAAFRLLAYLITGK